MATRQSGKIALKVGINGKDVSNFRISNCRILKKAKRKHRTSTIHADPNRTFLPSIGELYFSHSVIKSKSEGFKSFRDLFIIVVCYLSSIWRLCCLKTELARFVVKSRDRSHYKLCKRLRIEAGQLSKTIDRHASQVLINVWVCGLPRQNKLPSSSSMKNVNSCTTLSEFTSFST